MMSQKEIRAVLERLQDTAFKDYGLQLSPEATKDYIESMAHERVAKLFDTTFAKFSIADLLTAAELLEAPQKKPQKGLN